MTNHWKRPSGSGLNVTSSGSSVTLPLIATQCWRITVSSLLYTSGRYRSPLDDVSRYARRYCAYSGGRPPIGCASVSTISCGCAAGFQYAMCSPSRPAAAAAARPRLSSTSHGAASPVSSRRSPMGLRRASYVTSATVVPVVFHRSYPGAFGLGEAPSLLTNTCAK